MRSLIRNLLRQRLRTLLTVTGVALGIFTLVVLGALGEHYRAMIDEAKLYASGMVRLFTKTNEEGINPGVSEETRAKVAALPEVEAIHPSLQILYDGFDLEEDPLTLFVPNPWVEGIPAHQAELFRGQAFELLEGRWLRKGDERHAMVVDWLAQRRGLSVGDTTTIRHKPYEVVGIYHGPDLPMIPAGLVPYEPLNDDFLQAEIQRAQAHFRRLARQNPLLMSLSGVDPNDTDHMAEEFTKKQAELFRVYEIVPKQRDPEGTRECAEVVKEVAPDLAVITPDRISERMEATVAVLLVMTLIVTVLSTVVGGLLIVNTMTMAVIERRREIAIKAALGATPRQIALEFVGESALLAFMGAALGLALGALAIAIFEPILLDMLKTGARLFLITPRLAGLALGYALVMGVLAGGIPAIRASRIDPAITLREL